MKIKNTITKKNILTLLLFVWIIFSAYYVLNDQWQNFRLKYSQNAYQKGVGDSVRTLITQVEKCVKVPLYDGDKKVEVVSVECLQNNNQNQQAGK